MTGSNKLPTMGINGNKGIHFKFPNGYTLSVQIGTGNYCQNRELNYRSYRDQRDLPPSPDAEIAVWHEDGDMIPLVGDTVYGWFEIKNLPWLLLTVGADDATNESIAAFVIRINDEQYPQD